jgi:hypothetical protein
MSLIETVLKVIQSALNKSLKVANASEIVGLKFSLSLKLLCLTLFLAIDQSCSIALSSGE